MTSFRKKGENILTETKPIAEFVVVKTATFCILFLYLLYEIRQYFTDR